MSGTHASHHGDTGRFAADRLDALWDDLVRTGSADLSSATDGDATRLSLISYASLLVPRSEPASRERIRRRVFADYPEDAMRTASSVWATSSSAASEPVTLPRPWTVHPGHRPWWRDSIGILGMAITAALILGTIGGIVVLRPDDEPKSLPAAGSPDLGLSIPTTADDPSSEELLTLNLDGPPSTSYSIELARVTMDGGERWEMSEHPFAGVSVPFDNYVETGTLVVGKGDGEHSFQEGDRLDLNEAPSYLRNPGQLPVTFVMAIAYSGDVSRPEPPSGVTLNPLGSIPIPAIVGRNPEVVVRLTWSSLAPNTGATLPTAPKMSTVFVAVESGTLLAHTVPDAPVRSGRFGPDVTGDTEQPDFSEAPVDGIEVGPGETLTLDRTFVITDSAVVGNEPVEVLSLSYTVDDDAGLAESAAGEVTPNSVTMEIPAGDGRVGFGLYQIVLDPLSTWWYESDASLVLHVVEGNVSFTDSVGSTHIVESGGWFTYTGEIALQAQATAAGPVEVIAAVAYDEGNPPDMAGPEWGESNPAVLLGSGSATLGSGDATLMLYTEALSPDPANSLVDLQANRAALISILSGEADVVRYGGQVTVFEDAIAGGGPADEGQEYPFGVRVTASSGDAIVARPRSGYSLSTHGDEAPVVARLSISSNTPIDMTVQGPRGDEPISVYALDCQAELRPADDLRRLVNNPAAAELDPGMRDDAATGTAADAATATEITATVREALACLHFGTPLQGYAFYTDNALLAGAIANGLTLKQIDEMEQATPEDFPENFPATFSIDEISLFPDGRAGSWIFNSGELAYLTFVQDPETGRWLIDAWDDRERTE